MDWIYLSPHLDDVALSLGGLIWEQVSAGQRVSIWTVCGGDPPPGDFSPFAEALHERWAVGCAAIAERRAEDIVSCRRLGAVYHHFDIPDCVYRKSSRTGAQLYDTEESLWIPVHSDELVLVNHISDLFRKKLPADARLVCPLTLGNHVDHRLTRAAAENVGVPLYFYADYPYVLDADRSGVTENLQSTVASISPGGMLAWQEAVAAHRSQISTFWGNLKEMKEAIQSYYENMGGVWIWKKT